MQQLPQFLIGCCVTRSESVCFPFTEPVQCMMTKSFFFPPAYPQNGQLVDFEEIFHEYDNNCTELEMLTEF